MFTFNQSGSNINWCGDKYVSIIAQKGNTFNNDLHWIQNIMRFRLQFFENITNIFWNMFLYLIDTLADRGVLGLVNRKFTKCVEYILNVLNYNVFKNGPKPNLIEKII